ncbi:MAG: hypothetical protein M0016_04195 [Deltaproteobacteria bacterium]|jgi:hypothetical protein|nr:hypothetical protein [Deltaproteobacteria bacterium]MDA8304350.1 hypothetical protein [Deltaproteobacteria bacterium]
MDDALKLSVLFCISITMGSVPMFGIVFSFVIWVYCTHVATESGTGQGFGRDSPCVISVASAGVPFVFGSLNPFRQNALPNGLRFGKTVWQTAQAKWYFSAKGGIALLFWGKETIVKINMEEINKK